MPTGFTMKYSFFILFIFSLTSSYGQTQIEMNQAAADSMRKADTAMTAAYNKAITRGDARQKKLLIEAQRHWIKYREAHCTAVAQEYDKGSIQPMILFNCIAELTKERTLQLQRYVE